MTEKDRFYDDVVYEVWRRGGNSDRVDRDDLQELRECGYAAEDAAAKEIERQQHRRRVLAAGLDAPKAEEETDED